MIVDASYFMYYRLIKIGYIHNTVIMSYITYYQLIVVPYLLIKVSFAL